VCPDLEDPQNQQELLVMQLNGHQAIVRTVCFNPMDDLMLLSGGLNDADLKVWNSETGKNFSNLKGHNGSIHSIKMANDGFTAMSVGTDKYIRLWDVRAKKSIGAIDGTGHADMNEISFSSSPGGLEHSGSIPDGLACVGHQDGNVTFWDLKIQKCVA